MDKFIVKSGKIVASDPCYTLEPPTWCMGIIDNVKNGEWVAKIENLDVSMWGNRVSKLIVAHPDAVNIHGEEITLKEDFPDEPLDFRGGVDSGQFGFFDFDSYRNDEPVKEIKVNFNNSDKEDGEHFYSVCCDITLADKRWGTIPNGVVSSSGFGDGNYDVFGIKNNANEYVAFMVVFIGEDEDEDEEDEWDEEDEDL